MQVAIPIFLKPIRLGQGNRVLNACPACVDRVGSSDWLIAEPFDLGGDPGQARVRIVALVLDGKNRQ